MIGHRFPRAVKPRHASGRPVAGAIRPTKSSRPGLEGLESRRLLAASVSEFPLDVSGGPTIGIAAGPDGNLWFTESSNSVASISPTTGKIAQYTIPTNGMAPGAIAAASDGDLWFIETGANRLGKINPATGVVTEIPFNPSTTSKLQSIVSGPDGNLWFTEFAANKVGYINPKTLAVAEFSAPTSGSEPYGITVGPDKNLWFTEYGTNKVGYINPTTHATADFIVSTAGNIGAEGIVAGSDGNLWFTEYQASAVGAISPTTHKAASYALAAGVLPTGIAAGPDGNLWFTETTGNAVIARINPGTKAITSYYTTYGGAPLSIAAGPDGNLWFALSGSNQVGRVTTSGAGAGYTPPSTASAPPSSIQSDAAGNVWYTVPTAGEVGVIDPITHISTQYHVPNWNNYSNRPAQMVIDPNTGIPWYTENYQYGPTGFIGEIDPTTRVTTDTAIPTANPNAYGITFNPTDGNLWFTEFNTNKIGLINPTTKAISDSFVVIPAGSNPYGIVADGAGNLWFTEYTTGKVAEYNLTTQALTQVSLGSASSRPEGITLGPDGNIWFVEQSAGKIGEINPTTGKLLGEFAAPATGAINVGPDGNLWFTESASIGQFNISTHAITSYAVANATPEGVGAGADGNLWFTGAGTSYPTYYPNLIGAVTLTAASTATQLAITAQPPTSVTVGRGFGLNVTVENASGGLDTFYNGPVTVAIAANGGGGTLGGTLTETASGGVAFFPGLTIDTAGTGYSLQATAVGMTSATTNAFSVALAATHLVVTTQPPANITTGVNFTVTVAAEDSQGNVDASFVSAVGIALGNNPGGATLGGVTLVGAVGGVLTFSGLSIDNAGLDYTLNVTTNGLVSAQTNPINVYSPKASLLSFANQPTTVTSGVGFVLVVDAVNGLGTIDPSYNGLVTVALATGVAGGTLRGTLSAQAVAGVATFAGLTLDKAGTGYTIQATAAGLSADTTGPIAVTPGAATQLVVSQAPPTSVVSAAPFGLAFEARDAAGNFATGFGGPVTVSLGVNPPGGTLGGTLTVSAVGGIATFAGLGIDKASTGYIIRADSPGITPATAGPIAVTPGLATQLVVTAQPPGVLVVGYVFGLAFAAEDPAGNVDPTFHGPVSLALAGGAAGAALGGTTTGTAVAGLVTFSGLSISKVGAGYTIRTAGGLTPATTTAINIVKVGTAGDYSGDGKADVGVFRPSNATWYIKNSGGGPQTTVTYGWAGHDIPMPADYSGDGITDIAVFRPSTSQWFLDLSPHVTVAFGWAGHDTPVPAAYDPAAPTRIAVYRSSTATWYILHDLNNTKNQTAVTFGWAGLDLPVPADYEGTGAAQVAVFRPITGDWFIRNATTGLADTPYNLGYSPGDIPVPADYDGIGRAEVAIYRPATGQFKIYNPVANKIETVQVGAPRTDVPVPEDYTGSGRVDPAVYRPATAQWIYIDPASNSPVTTTYGAANTDVALPGPYTYRGNLAVGAGNFNAEGPHGGGPGFNALVGPGSGGLVSSPTSPVAPSSSSTIVLGSASPRRATIRPNAAAPPTPHDLALDQLGVPIKGRFFH